MHNPKYTVFVLLDGPKSIKHLSSTGGIAAAPIVKNIVQRIGPILGVKPVDTNDDEVMSKVYIDYKPLPDVLESF